MRREDIVAQGGREEGGGRQDGPPAMGIRLLVGTGNPPTTGCPFGRARNGTVSRPSGVVPLAQGRGQITHGILQENSGGHNSRPWRDLRNLVEKRKGSRPSLAKRLVTQRDKSTYTRAGAAVRIPLPGVLRLSIRPGVASCSLDSGGRQRACHADVRHNGTARQQCQQVPPLGEQGEPLCSSRASCSSWRAVGPEGAEGAGVAGGD